MRKNDKVSDISSHHITLSDNLVKEFTSVRFISAWQDKVNHITQIKGCSVREASSNVSIVKSPDKWFISSDLHKQSTFNLYMISYLKILMLQLENTRKSVLFVVLLSASESVKLFDEVATFLHGHFFSHVKENFTTLHQWECAGKYQNTQLISEQFNKSGWIHQYVHEFTACLNYMFVSL